MTFLGGHSKNEKRKLRGNDRFGRSAGVVLLDFKDEVIGNRASENI